MNDATKISEVDYKGSLLSFVAFALANACLFVLFCVLWVWQYHIRSDLSDTIDHIVVPFGWLCWFFSLHHLSTLRRLFPKIMAILISLGSAVLLSGILFLVKSFILAPLYDPMW